MAPAFVLALIAVVSAEGLLATREEGITVTVSETVVLPVLPEPTPMGEMPEKDAAGFWATEADACQACRFISTGSCAMYQTCICHATNTYFGVTNLAASQVSDKNYWRWACSGAGGKKYNQCFSPPNLYKDAFGDTVDPNHKKCTFDQTTPAPSSDDLEEKKAEN